MGKLVDSIRLRFRRRSLQYRARFRARDLTPVVQRTKDIAPHHILCFVTLHNEMLRLPYFLQYYRKLGVDHFLIVDNASTDGGTEYLADQSDVSLWRTPASYRRSRFGMDWMNALLGRYGHKHWCLCVDADELFVYPFCDTRPLQALTNWLDASMVKSFGAMLLDMYPKGSTEKRPYVEGMNPLAIAPWFDPGNYTISRNERYGNLWIQGGPRARCFFADNPRKAPALNKIPLVRWRRGYTYLSSTHSLLPRGLNLVYDAWGGEKASGVLLHMKFLSNFDEKISAELERGEHYGNSGEYSAYAAGGGGAAAMWCPNSERYINWRQLEILGLMSKGSWA